LKFTLTLSVLLKGEEAHLFPNLQEGEGEELFPEDYNFIVS
jgi:hypothetical protein